jgi:hypothetical protein
LIVVLGSVLIIFSIAFPVWYVWQLKGKPSPIGKLASLSGVAMFCGVVLLLPDRITELDFPWSTGKIKAASKQALDEAGTITKLRERVEAQSATVDLVASQATKAKDLSEAASEQTKEAAGKLKEIDKTLADAAATLKTLREEEGFRGMVIAAQNDDRASYDRLRKIAEDKGNRFEKAAADAYRTIYAAHSGLMYNSGFQGVWQEGVDPSKFSFAKLQSLYAVAPIGLKPGLLEYIWNRNDVPKVDRMDYMINVIKSDASLTAAEYAARYFLEGTSLTNKFSPMAWDELYGWWSQHRQEFVAK